MTQITSLLAADANTKRVTRYLGLRLNEWNTLFDVKGAGMLNHIWITFPPDDLMLGRRALIRAFWDNEPEPSIEAPMTDFFGIPFGFGGSECHYTSQYITVARHNGLNCYFQMPYAKSARIEIFPEMLPGPGGFYFQADYCEFPKGLPEEWRDLRFHAQYRFENPCENYGRNYLFLDAIGKGALIGATFGLEVNEPRLDAWCHGGGDTITIDGEGNPGVLHGIGVEDFFGHSWGVAPFHSPYIGAPYLGKDEEDRDKKLMMYRFFGTDPVLFKHSVRGVMGAMANNYTSVAYWYQNEPHRPFFKTPEADKRMPDSIATYGTYDIESDEKETWQLLAPFRMTAEEPFEFERPFEAKESGQESYEYRPGGKPSRADGEVMAVQWKPQDAQHHFIDFHTISRPAIYSVALRGNAVGYALRYVEWAKDEEVTIHFGFDDQAVVRVNDQVVFEGKHENGFEKASFKAKLKKGRNRLLVKLSNFENTTWLYWGFSLRVGE
jgi:hypothetical protein